MTGEPTQGRTRLRGAFLTDDDPTTPDRAAAVGDDDNAETDPTRTDEP